MWPQIISIVIEVRITIYTSRRTELYKFLYTAPTLLMTTISLSFTGKLLDEVSVTRHHFPHASILDTNYQMYLALGVMQEVDQLIMIIPVVSNLNGNLEMNLSARLATAANNEEFDDPMVHRSMIIGSLAVLQVQTVSVSFIAACIALILWRFVPRSGLSPSSGATNSTILALRNFLTRSIV